MTSFLIKTIVALLIDMILALLVMGMWNYSLAEIWTGIVPHISYWQAFALLILSNLLFKSPAALDLFKNTEE